MKIAALSYFSADNASSGRRAGARSSANQYAGGQYDVLRDGDRRRKPRVCEAARISPLPRLTTGLALQVIAQIELADCAAARIEAARAAYRRDPAASGAVFNFRA